MLEINFYFCHLQGSGISDYILVPGYLLHEVSGIEINTSAGLNNP